MNLETLHQDLIDSIRKGDFVGPMKKHYAEDIVAQEGSAPARSGRDALVEAESAYVDGVTTFHGVEVLATAVDDHGDGNGVVLYEVRMRWEHKDHGEIDVQQAVVERWRNGKISAIRFYGNFAEQHA